MMTQDREQLTSRAQTQSRAPHEPINVSDRLAFSVREFSALLGKSPTFGYRAIYAGRIKPISDAGRLMISREQIDAFLARADEYNPKQKAQQTEGGE
jgi:Helix-turn-helix domain